MNPRRLLDRVDQWLLAPAPPERLAALRVATGGFVLAYLVANIGEFDRLADRPTAPYEAIGVARLLGGPLSPAAVWVLFASLVGTGCAFVAGRFFRVTGPLFAVLVLVWASYHSSWGQMLHFEHLFTLHLLVLGFAPSAAAWSRDRARAGPQPRSFGPGMEYGWPIRLLAIITVMTYVIAGLAKLRESGLQWLDGSTLTNHIAYSATRSDLLGGFDPPLAEITISQTWLIAPMAVAALAVELGAPLALIGDRWRNAWVVAALIFHAATAATMMVWFPYQGLGVAMLPMFRCEVASARVMGVLRGSRLHIAVRRA